MTSSIRNRKFEISGRYRLKGQWRLVILVMAITCCVQSLTTISD